MAENRPIGTATDIAINATSIVPSITGTMPNDPEEPATASSAAAEAPLKEIIGDQWIPKRKSNMEISEKNRTDSYNRDATMPIVVKIAIVAATKNKDCKNFSKTNLAANFGLTRNNEINEPIQITNARVRNLAKSALSRRLRSASLSFFIRLSGAAIAPLAMFSN